VKKIAKDIEIKEIFRLKEKSALILFCFTLQRIKMAGLDTAQTRAKRG
jgi:hypothetical protein